MGENWLLKIKSAQVYKGDDICRDITLLYPPFRIRVEFFLDDARKAGLPVGLFETIRSTLRQQKLYREKQTKIRFNGMHFYGVAADIVFKDEHGNWTWSVTPAAWDKLGRLGKNRDLYWGGNWKGFRDCPHFQYVPATEEAQGKIINGDYPD